MKKSMFLFYFSISLAIASSALYHFTAKSTPSNVNFTVSLLVTYAVALIVTLLDGPGIIQEFREQGYQRPFVLAGITHLRKKATRPITLEFWGDNEDTLDIYRSLGFEIVNRFIAYHKEIQ